MPCFETLMRELRADGELDSVGEFTLDRNRAREKMRHFQLADPRAYVLELVQAAVLAGATEASFEIDTDDMRLEFDGRPFTTEDFDQLYSSMFARRRASGALRQLALGLNAAMALDPMHVLVESGSALMEMRAGADDRISAAEKPIAGTRIHVRDRFGRQTVVRFFRKLRGRLAEVDYLERNCRWAPLPIYLGGKCISGQPPLAEALARTEIEIPGARAVAGFRAELGFAEMTIFKEGVRIASHELAGFPPHFVACVDGAELEKDVSQSDVVRDEAYKRLLAALPEVLYEALRRLPGVVLERPSLEALLRRVLLHPLNLPLLREELGAAEAGKDPPSGALAAVPLWTSARNPRIPLSMLDLVRPPALQERVSWSKSHYPEVTRGDEPPIAVMPDKRERAYLKLLFGDRLSCADTALQNERKRAGNVERWHRRRMSPEIPSLPGALISIPLKTEDVIGEVGIFHDPFETAEVDGGSSLWLIKEGRLLEKRTIDPVIPGLAAALEADFRPSKLFDKVNINRTYLHAAIAVARALGPLMNEVASRVLEHGENAQRFSSLARRCLIPYLDLDWQGDGLRQFLASFGITGKTHLAYARRGDAQEPFAAISSASDIEGEDAPPLARVALFETLHGTPVSLRDLAARPAETWLYLPRDRVLSPEAEVKAEAGVLLLDEVELMVLWRFFGTEKLRDYTPDYDFKIAANRHLQKPFLALRPEGLLWGKIEAGDIQGYVGLRSTTPADQPTYAEVQLLKHGRHLDTVRYRVPIGPIAGMIIDDELTPTADWQGVLDDDRLARVRRLVLERAARLLVESCKRSGGSPAIRAILVNSAARLRSLEAVHQPWAEELIVALETAPLFARLDGRRVGLRRIREVLARDRRLEVWLTEWEGVVGDISDVVELAGDRFVLRLSGDEHQALTTIFRAEVLADARPWLQQRQEAREIAAGEPIERLELSREEALVATAVSDAVSLRVRGEVGLRRQPEKHGLELKLHKNGRLYEVLWMKASYSLVAMVEDEALELDEHGMLDVSGPRPAELAELCRARIPDLTAELVADQTLWSGPSREVARIHLIDHLAASSAFEPRKAEELEAARNLPAFDTPTGPCSFVDLCRSYADFDRQAFLLRSENRHGQPLDPRRRVLLVSRREAARLGRLFPVLENYDDRWAEEQQLRRQLEHAPALSVKPPERPLVSRKVRGRQGLRAHLWLPAEPDAKLLCAFGFAGRELRLESLSDLFPCAGVVTGKGLVLAAGRLTPDQREGLERSAFHLYKQLVKDLTRPSRGRELSDGRARAARRLLNQARVSLLDRFEKANRALDDDYTRLLPQLEKLRLSEGKPREQRKMPWQPVADSKIEVAEVDVRPGIVEPEIVEPETREAKLLHALHVELSCARELHAELLDEKNLDRILLGDLDRGVIARCFDHGVVVNRRHRLVRRLLESPGIDRVLATFLASAVYSAMNHFWQEIEDDHEREFHRELVGALLEHGSA